MRSAFASSRDFEASEVTFLRQEIRELERVIAEAQASRAGELQSQAACAEVASLAVATSTNTRVAITNVRSRICGRRALSTRAAETP